MSVDFIMTKFMYPLDIKDRPIIFGKLYFDNPRTTEEINYIANLLKQINYECAGGFPDRFGVFPENCVTLMTIYDMFYKNNCSDPVVEGFNQKYGKLKNIYKKLARMMVVIRSTDIIDIEDTKGRFKLFMSEGNNSIDTFTVSKPTTSEYNEEKINNYFSFASFILDNNGLSNNLLSSDSFFQYKRFNDIFINLLVMSRNDKIKNENCYRLGVFKNVEENIIKVSEKIGDRYKDRKFLFICKKIHYLFTIYNLNADMAFLEIMALLEMLLTHNPDTSRFNVEDSITKQFKGKLLMILYEKNKNIQIDNVEKELKLAYGVRSSIAHGNYTELEKNLSQLFNFYEMKKDGKLFLYESNQDALYKLIHNSMSWLKEVVELYINDEQRLELIKKI